LPTAVVEAGKRAVAVQELRDGVGVGEDAGHVGGGLEAADLERPVGEAHQRRLQLGQVDAATGEALQVAAETGQFNWLVQALLLRARLDAARGHEEDSGGAARGAIAMAESRNLLSGLVFGHAVLGFPALGLERVDDAVAELEEAERFAAQAGLEEPILIPWAPDLFEAYVRAGRTDAAGRVLATLERQAASTGTATANAALACCRGTLAQDFDAPFAEALAWDDRRPMPFERARTLLGYGRRLHRARRRAEARDRRRSPGAPPTARSPPSCSWRPRPSSPTCARSTASSASARAPSSPPRSPGRGRPRHRRATGPERPGAPRRRPVLAEHVALC
jgi:hypothetical protein